MMKFLIFIIILFQFFIPLACAEDSPFDVLNADDRYKAEPSKEFDINEGETEEQTIVDNTPTKPLHESKPQQHNQAQEQAGTYYNVAKIVALNKITAKSKEFSIKVGETAYFGNIAISVQKCWSNNDPYFIQNKILLKIVENKIDDDPQNIFYGWMISSNISASAMEHPSYEVIAIDCKNK